MKRSTRTVAVLLSFAMTVSSFCYAISAGNTVLSSPEEGLLSAVTQEPAAEVGDTYKLDEEAGFGTKTDLAPFGLAFYYNKTGTSVPSFADTIANLSYVDKLTDGKYYKTGEKPAYAAAFGHFMIYSGSYLCVDAKKFYNQVITFTAPECGTYTLSMDLNGLWNADTFVTVYADDTAVFEKQPIATSSTLFENDIEICGNEKIYVIFHLAENGTGHDLVSLNKFELKVKSVGRWGEPAELSPATPTEDRVVRYTCACGKTKDEIDHAWNSGSKTVTEGCENDGEITYECTICHITRKEPVPATGHNFSENVTDNGDGKTHGTYCDRCTTNVSENHSYTSEVITPPSYEGDGEMKYTCRCGYAYSEPIPRKIKNGEVFSLTQEAGFGTSANVGCFSLLYSTESSINAALKNLIPLDQVVSITAGKGYYSADEVAAGIDENKYHAALYNGAIRVDARYKIYNVVRFTAPQDGTYKLDFTGSGLWNIDTAVTVISNLTQLGEIKYISQTGQSLSVTKYIKAGETIDCFFWLTGGTAHDPVVIKNLSVTYVSNIENLCATHTFDGGTPVSTPDCENKGETVFTCAVCGHTYSEETEALGHKYIGALTDNEDGLTHKIHCSVCSKDVDVDHEYGSIVLEPATFEKAGREKLICDCGYSFERDIPKLIRNDTVFSMNIENGYASTPTVGNFSFWYSREPGIELALKAPLVALDKVATVSGNLGYFTDDEIANKVSIFHFIKVGSEMRVDARYQYYNIIRFTAPADGTYQIDFTGSALWNIDTAIEIVAGGETIAKKMYISMSGESVTARKYLKAGETLDCFFWLTGGTAHDPIVIKKLDVTYLSPIENLCATHTWNPETVLDPATCTEDGLSETVCKVCGHVKQTVLPAKGHSFEEGVVFTDDENGKTHSAYCTVCQAVVSVDHEYTDEKVTTEPTYTKPGVLTLTCVCGAKTTESIPKKVKDGTTYYFNVNNGFSTKTTFSQFSLWYASEATETDALANLKQLTKITTVDGAINYFAKGEATGNDKEDYKKCHFSLDGSEIRLWGRYGQYNVVRFTAPADGKYKFNFTGYGLWNIDVGIVVYANGNKTASTRLAQTNTNLDGTVELKYGETIDFMIYLMNGTTYDPCILTNLSVTYNPIVVEDGGSAKVGTKYQMKNFGTSTKLGLFTLYGSVAQTLPDGMASLKKLDKIITTESGQYIGNKYLLSSDIIGGNYDDRFTLSEGKKYAFSRSGNYNVIEFTAPASGTYKYEFGGKAEKMNVDVAVGVVANNKWLDELEVRTYGSTMAGRAYLQKGEKLQIVFRLKGNTVFDACEITKLVLTYISATDVSADKSDNKNSSADAKPSANPDYKTTGKDRPLKSASVGQIFTMNGFGTSYPCQNFTLHTSYAASPVYADSQLIPLDNIVESTNWPEGNRYITADEKANKAVVDHFSLNGNEMVGYATYGVYNCIRFTAPTTGTYSYLLSAASMWGTDVAITVMCHGWFLENGDIFVSQTGGTGRGQVYLKKGETLTFVARLTSGTGYDPFTIHTLMVTLLSKKNLGESSSVSRELVKNVMPVKEVIPENSTHYSLENFGQSLDMGPISLYNSGAKNLMGVPGTLRPLIKFEYTYFPDEGYSYTNGFDDGTRGFCLAGDQKLAYAEGGCYNVIAFKAPADGKLTYYLAAKTRDKADAEIMTYYNEEWLGAVNIGTNSTYMNSEVEMKAGEDMYFIIGLTDGSYYDQLTIEKLNLYFVENEEGSSQPEHTDIAKDTVSAAALGLAFMN